jgi:uncharacterized protein (TIGR02147 family)
MTNIFDFLSYRAYLTNWIESQGDRSYGLKGRIAGALNISSSLLSQVLKEEKSLTPDQTSDLCDFMGLNEIEGEYLHLLVEISRAGTPKYREKLKRKILALQEQSKKIGKRVPRNKELSDEQKAIYYSSWLYTGMRNLVAVPGFDHVQALALYLQIEPQVAQKFLRFLLENGLCLEEKGKLTYGPASTHIDTDSPFVNKHHQNWRLQGINHMDKRRDEDLFFTGPMSLSREAALEIRKMIPNFIQSVMKITGPSPSEQVSCLNIDWFKY